MLNIPAGTPTPENDQPGKRSAAALAAAFAAAGLGRLWRTGAPPEADLVPLERVLWIRLDHIGDFVMSLPALRALQLQHPHAIIDLLVRPSCRPLAQLVPGVRRVWTYDSPRMPERGHGSGLARSVVLARRLRRGGYSLAVETRGDDVARLLAWAAGAPLRLGPDRIFYEAAGTSNFSFVMTHPVALPATPRHAVLNNLQVLEPLGIGGEPPTVALREDAALVAAVLYQLQRRRIRKLPLAVHAHSREERRNWTTEKFAAALHHLVQLNRDVLLLGGRGDYAANEAIRAGVPAARQKWIHNCAGAFSLAQLPSLLARTGFLLSVDSGPMHLAALQGVPILALFLAKLAPRHHPWGQPGGVITAAPGMAVATIPLAAVLKGINEKLEDGQAPSERRP